MDVELTRAPDFFVHEQCRTQDVPTSQPDYQRVSVEVGRHRLFRRTMRREGELRRLSKHYDADGSTCTISAIIDFPCMKCGDDVGVTEAIGQVDIRSIAGDIRCQSCGGAMSVARSEHDQEQINPEVDRLTISAALSCRSASCRKHEFAMRVLDVRMDQLLAAFGAEQKPVDAAALGQAFDLVGAGRELFREADLTRFRIGFEKYAGYFERIDANILQEVEKQSQMDFRGAPAEELSRARRFVEEVMKEAVGGAVGHTAGAFLFEILQHSVM
jgi:hypothetical protein